MRRVHGFQRETVINGYQMIICCFLVHQILIKSSWYIQFNDSVNIFHLIVC